MSLEGLLTMTVHVHRRSGRTDRFGQAVDVNPRQNTEGEAVATYPCRMTGGKGGMVMQERAVDVFETRYKIFVQPDADIHEDDSVRVINQTGAEILPLSKIANKSVQHDGNGTPNHLELEIWSQKGPS